MAGRALVLFDDGAARAWRPFSLTRPAGELRFGALLQRERAERVLGARCVGHLTSDHLAGFDEPGAPPVLAAADLPGDRDVVYLSARAVPDWGAVPALEGGPALLTMGGEPCGWFAPAGSGAPPGSLLQGPDRVRSDVREVALQGRMLVHVWELVTRSAEQVARDVAHLFPAAPPAPPPDPAVHRLGSHLLVLGRDVEIEPGAVLDLRHGPVWLDDGATVRTSTRLAGPAYVGRGTTLLGGCYEAVSVGPVCKVHGEMEESVVLGWSNKAHDGFLGHAYLGAWVNLGAMTTNSDLKNNYGTIRIWTPAGEADTGEIKIGCLLGDHVKTGIGTLLNTGTVVGAGSNLYGAAMPPKHVPPFRWGTGSDLSEYDLDRFLETAEVVMGRRDVELTPGQRGLLRAAFSVGREEVE